ncbi:MAG: DUF917 family protein [bacterium]|nr:DUF917 family protein [bacterium]MDZ4295849.1 DUF917 family protein [Patescibacteria group bacterium]MDZ4295864.1 DUF917 family protein [Patescibacteria group bacterium]
MRGLGDILESALCRFESLARVRVRGIIPGEIGAEGLAFQAGAHLGLPVADSDLVGGRAAPEIQMDVFSVYRIPITPALAATSRRKSLFFSGAFSAKEIEEVVRGFFKRSGSAGVLVGYPIQARDYRTVGISGTVTSAIEIGEYLSRGDLDGLLGKFRGAVLFRGKVNKVTLQSEGGF